MNVLDKQNNVKRSRMINLEKRAINQKLAKPRGRNQEGRAEFTVNNGLGNLRHDQRLAKRPGKKGGLSAKL